MSALFPPTLVRAISRLRLAVPRLPRAPHPGEHQTRQGGAGMEFRDYRPYAGGDDLRRIDWNVYRRSGRLMLREHDIMRRVPVYILLDCSDSMFFDAPPRVDIARRFAAAIAAAALGAHDPVTIAPFGTQLESPIMPGLTARRQLGVLLRQLETLTPRGHTHLGDALTQFARLTRSPGLVVVISDFYDPAGLETSLAPLARRRDQLLLAQVAHPDDTPNATADEVELIDSETDARVSLVLSDALLTRYRERRTVFEHALQRCAARRRGLHVVLHSERELLPQLMPLVAAGMLLT